MNDKMKTLSLTESQMQALEDVLNYIYENEATSYEEYCLEDENEKENHIYYKAVEVGVATEMISRKRR